MREIRTSGSMSGDGKRDHDAPGVQSTRARPRLYPLEGKARRILFEAGLGGPNRELAIGDLETGEWSVLGRGAYPVYSTSGHVLYQTNRYESGLWAMPVIAGAKIDHMAAV